MQFSLINALGDQLSATPVLRALKQRLPDENIRIFEPSKPEIFKNNPYLNVGNRENGIRMYLDPPSRHLGVPEGYARQISAKLGWENDPLLLDDVTPQLFLTQVERDAFAELGGPRTVAVNGHAHSNVRRWAYYPELCTMLLRAGWKVYHVGSNDHKDLPCTRSFKGQLNIRQSAAVIAACSRAVCNDTGIMHLAAAAGTPCVVTFGYVLTARPYATTRPLNYNTQHDKRCHQERCALSARCARLDELKVRQVFAEVVR